MPQRACPHTPQAQARPTAARRCNDFDNQSLEPICLRSLPPTRSPQGRVLWSAPCSLKLRAYWRTVDFVTSTSGLQASNATWRAKGVQFWTYAPSANGAVGTCWPKPERSGIRAHTGVISGPVGRAAPPTAPPPTAPPPGPHHSANPVSLSIGAILLIAVGGGMVLPYVAIGVIVQHRRGETGRDLFPHRTWWAGLVGLIGAGCTFTFSRGMAKVRGASGFAAYEAL